MNRSTSLWINRSFGVDPTHTWGTFLFLGSSGVVAEEVSPVRTYLHQMGFSLRRRAKRRSRTTLCGGAYGQRRMERPTTWRSSTTRAGLTTTPRPALMLCGQWSRMYATTARRWTYPWSSTAGECCSPPLWPKRKEERAIIKTFFFFLIMSLDSSMWGE